MTLLLAGCGTAQDARFTGPSPPCPGAGGSTSTLVRRGGGFAYAPSDGALLISGGVAADGSLSGTLPLGTHAKAGGNTGAAEGKTALLTLSVSGQIAGDTVTLAYAAGACRADVRLVRDGAG